jgi:hypothetical protein
MAFGRKAAKNQGGEQQKKREPMHRRERHLKVVHPLGTGTALVFQQPLLGNRA